jgi:glycosyltransferase involved in cell wall biosynthesis
MTGPGPSPYIVITPTRDEERYLPLTIESMCRQTVRPRQWILVDDGSSDRTGLLIDRAAATHPWITAVHRIDRGARVAGSGVIAAFYEGFAQIVDDQWKFIVKFDGDLSFEPDYFERCVGEFESDSGLGIGGGTCCIVVDERRIPEFTGEPRFHVRGPTKIYRRQCFEEIGGLIQAPGWDTVDLLAANRLGWKTRTFPDITLVHHRPTGGAYGSWANYVKNGLANYITGYDPVFMACKCARRLLRSPHLQGIGLWWGFMKAYLEHRPQIADRDTISYVRRQQRRALMLRPSLWR